MNDTPLKSHRCSSVSTVNRIWNELSLKENNQGVKLDVLATTLSEKYTSVTKRDWTWKIRIASGDGLLGQRFDENFKSIFELPRLELSQADKGDRDWFCFRCHTPGEVYKCQKCTKSFHVDCHEINKSVLTTTTMEKDCDHCLLIESAKRAMIVNANRLNEMILLIIKDVLDDKLDILNNASGWSKMMFGSEKEAWRFPYFIFSPMDVNAMQNKALQEQYRSMEEFRLDCLTLCHNVGVYFGTYVLVQPSIFDTFLKKVDEDLEEIELCADCFYHEKKKNEDEYWFCQPCVVQHEVVWADVPGFPPVQWPAKVMKRSGGKCEIWYFGPDKFRKLIPEDKVYPITELRVDRKRMSKKWKLAVAELEVFQRNSSEEH